MSRPKDKTKGNPVGRQRGKKLTPLQVELVHQTYAITGNKRETARQLSLSESCVANLLKKAAPMEIIKARQDAALDLAGKTHSHVDKILDSIGPDDLKSGLIVKEDADGNIISAKGFGPSLMQKVTAAAIMTDKLGVIEQYRKGLAETVDTSNAMLTPDTVAALTNGIKQSLKSIEILRVSFGEDESSGIEQRANALMQEAERAALSDQPVEEAEVEEISFYPDAPDADTTG